MKRPHEHFGIAVQEYKIGVNLPIRPQAGHDTLDGINIEIAGADINAQRQWPGEAAARVQQAVQQSQRQVIDRFPAHVFQGFQGRGLSRPRKARYDHNAPRDGLRDDGVARGRVILLLHCFGHCGERLSSETIRTASRTLAGALASKGSRTMRRTK